MVAPGGKLSIRQQQNLDWVGYGTLDGAAIVSSRQQEVTGTYRSGYEYGDKQVLPIGYGYFFFRLVETKWFQVRCKCFDKLHDACGF